MVGCRQTGRSTKIPQAARPSTTTRSQRRHPGTSQKEPDLGGLPTNWEEHKDPSSGKTFYYNKVTKETSWDKPKSGLTSRSSSARGLPPDWEEHKDPSTAKTFYYNKVTKETSWDKPKGAFAPAPAAPGGLPPDWEEHKDPSTGKTFYYNKVTKDTSWENPREQLILADFLQIGRSTRIRPVGRLSTTTR